MQDFEVKLTEIDAKRAVNDVLKDYGDPIKNELIDIAGYKVRADFFMEVGKYKLWVDVFPSPTKEVDVRTAIARKDDNIVYKPIVAETFRVHTEFPEIPKAPEDSEAYYYDYDGYLDKQETRDKAVEKASKVLQKATKSLELKLRDEILEVLNKCL